MNIQLERRTPEAQGVSSAAVLNWVQSIEQNVRDLHSLMLLRRGAVIAEGWWQPYRPERPHMLFSLSKSFTSTAVGLVVAEGRLSVDDPVISFFPDDLPRRVSDNLAAMQVRHLLTMSTGHDQDTLPRLFRRQSKNWVRSFLAQPVKHQPGAPFVYNSGATYMLSAIVQRVAGVTLLDYLQPRLFEPLGIQGATWETCPLGINTGGWGLKIKTEDIARFGQMYLQGGDWQGQRILPEAWVQAATSAQVSNAPNENPDWAQGYGYQFWRCQHNAYRGDGAFGQYCLVMPDQEAVLAITAGVGNMQQVLDLVWEHLLPAMQPAALPADESAQCELSRTLAGLSLSPQAGAPTSPVAAQVSGNKYVIEANAQRVQSISLDLTPAGSTLTVRAGRRKHQVNCGNGVWVEGMTTLDEGQPRPVAASGAWTADDTYTIKLCFYETPFCPTITCRFDQDRLIFDFKANVSFGPLERPTLVGQV